MLCRPCCCAQQCTWWWGSPDMLPFVKGVVRVQLHSPAVHTTPQVHAKDRAFVYSVSRKI